MPKVSVVIPVYNDDNVVSRAIDSALSQTLTDVEIIVVDDASTDDTIAVLESYGDQIEYYSHDENRGGSAARNTGIEAATGEYIAFLDSDDAWAPTKLEKQVSDLQEKSDSWVASYCGFKQRRSNKVIEYIDNKLTRPTGFEGGEELVKKVLLKKFAHGGASTLLVKRDTVLQLGGFDLTFQRHQDIEFLVRLLNIGKISYIDKILVDKYDTGSPNPDDVITSMKYFNKKFEEEIKSYGIEEDINKIQNFIIAKHNLSNGNFKRGVSRLYRSKYPHYRDVLGVGLSLFKGIKHHIV